MFRGFVAQPIVTAHHAVTETKRSLREDRRHDLAKQVKARLVVNKVLLVNRWVENLLEIVLDNDQLEKLDRRFASAGEFVPGIKLDSDVVNLLPETVKLRGNDVPVVALLRDDRNARVGAVQVMSRGPESSMTVEVVGMGSNCAVETVQGQFARDHTRRLDSTRVGDDVVRDHLPEIRVPRMDSADERATCHRRRQVIQPVGERKHLVAH